MYSNVITVIEGNISINHLKEQLDRTLKVNQSKKLSGKLRKIITRDMTIVLAVSMKHI